MSQLAEKYFEGLELKTPKLKRQINGKTWKEDYERVYNIKHISNHQDLPVGNNVIYVTSCTGNKSDLARGRAEEMYLSVTNQGFYKTAKKAGVQYGTISGHLGIIFSEEEFDAYDTHTSEYMYEEQFIAMGRLIEEKCKKRGIDTIVFCYSSPIFSEPFLKRLAYTDLKVYYVTKTSILVK